jgi:hypothetical protein
MQSGELMEYFVYPDGSCYSLEEYTLDDLVSSGHSDDCKILELPDNEDPDEYFYNLVFEVNLGNSSESKTIFGK